jgi:hypothetical protein
MSFAAFFWTFAPLSSAAVVLLNRRRLHLSVADLLSLLILVVLAVMFIGLAVTPEVRDS